MKILLACLMCIVLPISQAYAIDGGPVYGGKGKVSTTGTYAGVLSQVSRIPLCCDDGTGHPVSCSTVPSPGSPLPCANQPTRLNTIALFSVQIPKTGIGTGTLVIFNIGETYTGTMQAVADPDSAVINGLITASFPFIQIVTSTDSMGHTTQTAITVSAIASGKLDGKIKGNKNSSLTSARMTGSADVQFSLTVDNPNDEIIYKVIGFKQANL